MFSKLEVQRSVQKTKDSPLESFIPKSDPIKCPQAASSRIESEKGIESYQNENNNNPSQAASVPGSSKMTHYNETSPQ